MVESKGNYAVRTAQAMGADVQEQVTGFVYDAKKAADFWSWKDRLPKRERRMKMEYFNSALTRLQHIDETTVLIVGSIIDAGQAVNLCHAFVRECKKRNWSVEVGEIGQTNSELRGFKVKVIHRS